MMMLMNLFVQGPLQHSRPLQVCSCTLIKYLNLSYNILLGLIIGADYVVLRRRYCDHFVTMFVCVYVNVYVCGCSVFLKEFSLGDINHHSV